MGLELKEGIHVHHGHHVEGREHFVCRPSERVHDATQLGHCLELQQRVHTTAHLVNLAPQCHERAVPEHHLVALGCLACELEGRNLALALQELSAKHAHLDAQALRIVALGRHSAVRPEAARAHNTPARGALHLARADEKCVARPSEIEMRRARPKPSLPALGAMRARRQVNGALMAVVVDGRAAKDRRRRRGSFMAALEGHLERMSDPAAKALRTTRKRASTLSRVRACLRLCSARRAAKAGVCTVCGTGP